EWDGRGVPGHVRAQTHQLGQARRGADRCTLQRRLDRGLHRAHLAGGARRRARGQIARRGPDSNRHRLQGTHRDGGPGRQRDRDSRTSVGIRRARETQAAIRSGAGRSASRRYATLGPAAKRQRRSLGWVRLRRRGDCRAAQELMIPAVGPSLNLRDWQWICALAADIHMGSIRTGDGPMSAQCWETACLREMLELAAGRLSNRKLDLFNLWCCHTLRPYLRDKRSIAAVRYAEQHVDQGWPLTVERDAVRLAAKQAVDDLIGWSNSDPRTPTVYRHRRVYVQ